MTAADSVHAVLRKYRQVADSPRSIVRVTGGFSGATVDRIETAAGTFALRGWPAGANRERLLGLHDLLCHLSQRGLSFVAAPCKALNGSTLVSVNERLWQLEPWMPGRADYHAAPSRQRLSAAMQVLASWHLAAATYESSELALAPRTGIAPCVPERLERFQRLTPDLLARTEAQAALHSIPELAASARTLATGVRRHAAQVQSNLRAALMVSVPLQFCLRDIWHDHVLFTGETVSGLIDPSAARIDTIAADLSRLLGSLVEDNRTDWQHALAAYSQVRPLSLAEESLIPVLDASGVVLSAVTWLEWLGPHRRTFADPASAVRRVEHLIRRLASGGT